MDNERLMMLSKEQLVEIAQRYDSAATAITHQFTITATGDVYGDKSKITDQNILDLLKANNHMTNQAISAYIEFVTKEQR